MAFKLKDKPCRLYCQQLNKNVYYDMLTKVEDGSKCMPYSNDVCIDGACHVN